MPANPDGPGHFRDPVQPDREPRRPDGDGYWAAVLGSPAARLGTPRSAPAIDSMSLSHVFRANSQESLKSTALALLGPASHDVGIAYGLAEGGQGAIEGLLDFLQMIVLNGLYNKVQWESTSWNPLVRAEYRGVDYVLHGPMETAHRQFRQLMDELRLVVSHPVEFFGSVWNAEVKEYSQRWQRYEWLMEHRSISNEFEAGRIVGQTLLEVVLLLTIVFDGVGLAAKGVKALGELPEMARLAAGVAKENLQKVPGLARLASGVTREKAEGLLKALRERLRTGGGGTVEETSAPAPRPKSVDGERKWKYQDKQTLRKEPGAVPTTPDFVQAYEAAKGRTAPAAPNEWPTMSDNVAQTFGATPQADHTPGGTKLYRVIGEDEEPTETGRYWSLDPPPVTEGEWRASAAVKDDWNGDGGYLTATVPEEGLNAWTGPAGPQLAAKGIHASRRRNASLGAERYCDS